MLRSRLSELFDSAWIPNPEIDVRQAIREVLQVIECEVHRDDLLLSHTNRTECSGNDFDPGSMSSRARKGPAARHERRVERFCKGYVHRVVGGHVLTQRPRPRQEIEMRVTMEIEVGEIRNGFGRAGS